MMRSIRTLLTAVLLLLLSQSILAQGDFSTSLHATRDGKAWWYDQGFFLLTNIDIASLGCKSCHGPTDADGNAYTGTYQPGCVDCHPTGNFDRSALREDQCFGCHGRQAAEIQQAGFSDVHRARGMKCWDCHKATEMHGDGNSYISMLEPGAMTADCADCHTTLPSGHSQYDPHNAKLHCSTCHTASVISCYNCHFESVVESAVKRPKQLIKDFVLLLNRDKDGKVFTGSFQSLTYQGNSFVAFAPYYSHVVQKEGRRCVDCHVNLGGSNIAITEYNQTGGMQFAEWNTADSTLHWMKGVVPMPPDYATSFRMDFLSYGGATTDPVSPGKNWSLVERAWDAQHMLFATPLRKEQMEALGGIVQDVHYVGVAEETALAPNYPNPFNPSTVITYGIAQRGHVELRVHDARGAVVRRLVSRSQDAGKYSVSFDASGLPAGVFLLQLRTANRVLTRKMLLLK
jgi:hypothetical protein